MKRMYLSRLELDVTNRKTLQALTSPSIFHGAVEAAFEGERKRNLWRIDRLDGHYYLMVLSEEKPDLAEAAEQFSDAEKKWVTKDYDRLLKRVQKGTVWRFRLCANPTYSVAKGPGERGRVCAHTTRDNQRAWLMEQGKKHGFCVKEDGFDVVQSRWYHFYKGNAKHRISMLSVTFEGQLTVTDEIEFCRILTEGIGREKAYGVGLMTLMRSTGGV